MAESVDALVSNTSGETRAGSTPALGTQYTKSVATESRWYEKKDECCKCLFAALYSCSLALWKVLLPLSHVSRRKITCCAVERRLKRLRSVTAVSECIKEMDTL